MPRQTLLHSFIVPLLLVAPLAAQEAAVSVAALDRDLPAIMDSAGVPGLTLVVFEHGKVVAARAYGVRNSTTRQPVDTATVFEAASLTKQVTAYIAMRLSQQGNLDLDRPLASYLPHPDLDDRRSKLVTARMVLSHSSGLPNWRPDGGHLAFDADPGTRFGYSGEGYVWLGMVMEKITGLPLKDLAVREVFQPLGMTHSSLVWQDRFAGNVAVGHTDDGPIDLRTSGDVNAAASLRTTALDYARLLLSLLQARGLSRATVTMMFTPVIDVAPGMQWGSGVGIEHGDSGRAIFQWGDNYGYKATLLVDPDRGTGLVFFSNSQSGMSVRDAIVSRVMPGSHPATTWNSYEQYNAPTRNTIRELTAALRSGGTTAMIARYGELRRTEPAAAFDESQLNTLGYNLLREKRLTDAIAVFQLNVSQYPDASNPYDSLGEAYAADGQLDPAIKNYEKALALNPSSTNAVQQLKVLRARQASTPQ